MRIDEGRREPFVDDAAGAAVKARSKTKDRGRRRAWGDPVYDGVGCEEPILQLFHDATRGNK